MNSRDFDDQSHSLQGPTDRGALIDFRDTFCRQEPLADGRLDDFIDPDELRVTLTDGVGTAEGARLDIVWTTKDNYNIHYTDTQARDLRWDVHPNDYLDITDMKHFHPPPDASSDPQDVEDSCIEISEIMLVARATHKLWRTAYDRGSFEGINNVSNPP